VISPSQEIQKAIRRLRLADEESFKLVMKWVDDSLKDQTLTNEALFDTNKLFHGQGHAACLRQLLQALEGR
jgi:hypothetical protein